MHATLEQQNICTRGIYGLQANHKRGEEMTWPELLTRTITAGIRADKMACPSCASR